MLVISAPQACPSPEPAKKRWLGHRGAASDHSTAPFSFRYSWDRMCEFSCRQQARCGRRLTGSNTRWGRISSNSNC